MPQKCLTTQLSNVSFALLAVGCKSHGLFQCAEAYECHLSLFFPHLPSNVQKSLL